MALAQAEILRKTGLVINPVHGVDQRVDTSSSTPTTIKGTVASDGSISGGSNFTVTHGGVGSYTVTFGAGFGSAPVVVATVNSVDLILSLSSISSTGFTVTVHTTSAVGQNAAFSFIAMST